MNHQPFTLNGRTSQRSQRSLPLLRERLEKEMDAATGDDERKEIEYALMVINGHNAPDDKRPFLKLSLDDRTQFRADIVARYEERKRQLAEAQAVIDAGGDIPENYERIVKASRQLKRAVDAITELREAAQWTIDWNNKKREGYPTEASATKSYIAKGGRRTRKQPVV